MRRISNKLTLALIPTVLALGFSLPSHAQSSGPGGTLSGFALGALPNPVGDGLDSTVTGAVFGDGTDHAPDGSIDFYISIDPTVCSGPNSGTDLGTVAVTQSGTNGLATTSASGLSPGTYPICGYYSGDSYYANASAGPFVLTVWAPTSMIVYVPGASTPGSTITFNVVLTTPSGQTSPSYGLPATGTCTSSCIEIEDPANGNAVVAGPLPVTNITVNGQSAIGATLSTSGLSGNEYLAVYSGDSNYQQEQVRGTFFIENPLTSVIPASFMAGAPIALPYIACTPPSGGQGLQITLNGIGFNTSSTAQVQINGTYQNLPLTGSTNTTLTTCLPATALATAATLNFQSITGNTIGGPVAFQVYAPWTVATAVSSTPSTFPYGSTLSSLVAATVDPTATTDAAVPTGTVTFSLTGTAPVVPTVTLATTPLTQSTATAGTYQSPLMAPFDINNSQKVISADLNGDGYVDVVGLPGNVDGNPAGGAFLQVFLSTGANAFQTEEQVFAGCAAQDFAVGDINADNIPDLVVVCPGNAGTGFPLLAYYMLGNGDGTFQQPVQFGAGSNVSAPTQVVIGTFDFETNNSVPINSIAAIDGVNGYMQVITPFGNNPCNTSPCDNDVYFYTYGPVFNAQVADFDQDGLSDIVLGEYSSPNDYGLVLPLINDSSSPGNNFNVDNPQFFSASTSYLWSMTVTDVNGDGFPDVAIADTGTTGSSSTDPGNVLIFENDGTGNIPNTATVQINSVGAVAGAPFPIVGTPSANAAVAPGWNLVYSATGDNGDIFVGQLLRQDASTWELTGSALDTGTFPNSIGRIDQIPTPLPGLIVAGDMNGDGYLDFAATGLIDYDSVWCCTQDQLVPYYYGNNAQASINNPGEVPTPGTYSLAMKYPGNPLYQANNRARTQIVVTQGPVTGTVTGPGTVTYGATVTLNATVYPVTNGALPTGTITFYDGSNPIGSPVILTPGEGFSFASINTSTLSAGTHTIYITYSGDPNYLAASNFANTQVVVNGQGIAIIFASPTSSSVSAGTMVSFQVQGSDTPLPAGEAITFTGLPISGLPSANTNANGVATFNYGAFPPGNYSITANYAGDGVYAAAQSTFSLTVSPTLTTVSLTSSANPVTYPTTVDLTATATTGGLGIPTGNIEFDDNAVPLTSLPLSIVNGNSGLLQGKTFAINNLANVVTVTGDFNHDGIPDIATLQAALDPSIALVIMLGNGDGTFQTPIVYGQVEGTTAIDSTSDSMAVADLTGSGFADSLVIGADDGNIDVFLYNSGNTPGILNLSQPITTNLGSVFGVATGNFGGNPLQSIAAISNNTLEIFANTGGGSFSNTPVFSFTPDGTTSYTGIVAADFNQDGIADIAISDNAGPDVAVYIYNTGAGQFTGATTYNVGASATGIAAGNINNDAYPDLAVLSSNDNTVDVLLNDQTGAFLNSTSYGVTTFPTAVAIGDFNGDGFGDIAVTGDGTGQGSGTSILLSSANGAMTGEVLLPVIDNTGGFSVATADFNQDGNTDLVVGSNGVTVYLDSSAQAFDQSVSLTAGTHPLSATYSGAFFSSAPGTLSQVVNQSVPVVTWANPLPINYGTPLSATQLNATPPDLAGALSYTPGIGTILTAGTHQLAVTFTPVDTVDYQSVTQFVSITVNQVATTVTWRNPARINYGTALSATQLNATASVPGAFVYDPALGTVLSAGTHQLAVTFTPNDSVDYAVSTGTVSITVNQATPTITWANPAGITYGAPLSAAQLNATGSVPGVLTYTPAAGTILTAGTHILSVTLSPTDGTDYLAVSKTATIVVGQATSTVTWATPAAITYGTTLSAAQLDATASVPGTFVYNPVAGTLLAAGTHPLGVTFTPTDTTDYAGSIGATTIQVNQATPVVTWNTPAAITYGTTLSATQLNATASVPGSFVYSPAAGTLLTAGTHTLGVTFTPTDNTDYATASATSSIVVNQATPTVTWAAPAAITYGTKLNATQLNATASVPGTLTYTPAAGTVLTTGSHPLTVTFAPTDTVNYKIATATVDIAVIQATPTVTWATPAAITYGTALSATQLNATASVPGTLAYTPASGTVLSTGSHPLTVTFTPTDGVNYKVITDTVNITVGQATPTITWAAPGAINYGAALSATQLNATASVPGTLIYNPSLGTVLAAGSHQLSVTFAPTDSADYASATANVTIQVNQVAGIITWTAPTAITYGTALSAAQLNATASVPGTFAYTPALGTVLAAGTHTLSVTFTPTDIADYKPATSTVSLLINQAAPTLTWPTPASIGYGTVLGAGQLNATASAPGTFAYTPAAGTVLSGGPHTLSVTFTPTDATDYTTATATVTLQVTQGTPVITWPSPGNINYGVALSATQLDATATPAGGTFVYNPPAGATLPVGTQTLSVTYTPTDTTNYATAVATTTIKVIGGFTLTSVAPSSVPFGSGATTVTLTGSGFTPAATVQLNGTTISSTYVSPSTLTAVIPASFFKQLKPITISVYDTVTAVATVSVTITVGLPNVGVDFSGPSTAAPGEQPTLNLVMTQPYPVDLQGTMTLTVDPLTPGAPTDPAVQFSTGGTTFTFTIPAGSTTTPTVQLQTGTDSSTITVTLAFEANGQPIDVPSIQPVVITVPDSAPLISSVKLVRNGNTLTVDVQGYSTTRDVGSAIFDFTPASGSSISNPEVTVDVSTDFTTWYSGDASLQFGSSFSYSQVFNLSNDNSTIGSVSVVLTNTVGQSNKVTAH